MSDSDAERDGDRIVVGYTADDSGADALALGARMAAATGAQFEVVMVLPIEARGGVVPRDPGHERRVKEQAQSWLAEAFTRLRETDAVASGVEPGLHIRYADSFAAGLIAAAHEFGAWLIVVGSARGGMLGLTRLGSVANELLRTSDVPVVVAPAANAAGPARRPS
ncbi:universal stress protein [Agromyces soli]